MLQKHKFFHLFQQPKEKATLMSENLQKQSSELFVDLSEEEQEPISGGSMYPSFGLFNMFFQRTEIASFANIDSNYSDGSRSFASKQQSGYKLSQVTVGFSGGGFSGGGGGGGFVGGIGRHKSRQNLFNMFMGMLSMFG
jgi:uncharacterized membrane protein YgcG